MGHEFANDGPFHRRFGGFCIRTSHMRRPDANQGGASQSLCRPEAIPAIPKDGQPQNARAPHLKTWNFAFLRFYWARKHETEARAH
jgi:hypothetical protein